MQDSNQKGNMVPAGTGKKFNLLGDSITAIFTKETTAGKYYVFEDVTPPGFSIPPHVHEREDELIYVVEGEYEILIDDKKIQVKQGDNIFLPKHVPHSFKNIGNKAGKLMFTIVPGDNFEQFFDALQKLPAGPPDMQKVKEIFAAYGIKILIPGNA